MSAPLTLHPEVGQTLAMAIVASSTTPMLLLNSELIILAVSTSFCSAFGIDHDSAVGAKIGSIGDREWAAPQLEALLMATASDAGGVEEYRMDLKRKDIPTRCLILTVRKLDYLSNAVRVAVTVTDITDARAAERLRDSLERDNAVLLQEIQHRVANSLQIIASVLMQSARRVTSNESRLHLTDAHSRIMSVAALQQHLSSTAKGDVALRPYFTDLCRSIGASMIADHDQLALKVSSDDARIDADTSVSLGLIVTELVINALKHAFPNGRTGEISVNYAANGTDWKLSVTDNGVGMPDAEAEAHAGLGTTIVQALAKKLTAKVTVHKTSPGTTIDVEHKATTKPIVAAPL